MPCHLLWLRQSEEKQERGRDIGEDPIFAAELRRILGHVNKMDKVRCVRGVG